MKTELQKEFEAQTPTIKGVEGNEYNLVYCSWLEFQVEKARGIKALNLQRVVNCPFCGTSGFDELKQTCFNSECSAYFL